jgi:hypothetical protein
MLHVVRGRPRGLFFASNHPWVAVVVLAVVVALIVYQTRKRR